MLTLRDYQEKAIHDIRAEYKRGRKSVLYQLPTGAGKSAIFNRVAATVSTRGRTACITVHRDELLQQTIRAMEAQGIPYGVIAPGYPRSSAAVQIASIWTLARRLEKWPHFDLLIADECLSGGTEVLTERGA